MNWTFLKKWYWIILWIEFYHEMNEWIIFWIDICHFWWKVPSFVHCGNFLDNFRALFLFNRYQRVPYYWIELSFELNEKNFFELNNILKWILGKAILNRILNESFFGKHWIESDRVSDTPTPRRKGNEKQVDFYSFEIPWSRVGPQRSIETIASFDQWSINHQKLLKAMVATSKTHRKTIDGNGQTAQKTFNSDGLLKNHWKFAMVSSKPLKFTMVS